MEQKYSYGLDGLMNLLGCSKTTAWRIKKSGIIDNAYTQVGRKIIFDNEKVFRCLKEKQHLSRA